MDKNRIEKVYNQIKAPDNLKEEVMSKMKEEIPNDNNHSKKNINLRWILSIAAVFIVTFSTGTFLVSQKEKQPTNIAVIDKEEPKNVEIDVDSPDLLHFSSNDELREFVKENYQNTRFYNTDFDSVTTNEAVKKTEALTDTAQAEVASVENKESNYYKTNTQEENVDEADIVKTDGEYIYYVTNDNVYIVKANDLELESKIEFTFSEKEANYFPSELFIKDNKLIIIGSYIEYDDREYVEMNSVRPYSYYNRINTTKTYIYDIKDKKNPEEIRQVDIDGDYQTSRMIGDTLYLISSKYKTYREDIEDKDLLPVYHDSISSSDYKNVDCSKIIYNENSSEFVYKTVGALNINDDKEIQIETFLGYSDNVYCSDKNLYITSNIYNEGTSKVLDSTEIYKFNIENGGLTYKCKNIIDGYIKDQFSMDEYDGMLRVATTVTIQSDPVKQALESAIGRVTIGEQKTNNVLFVLDENLEVIGKLTNFGLEEKIYSVRFIGNIAYIVTFKQVDPLYVMDLSDPTNPVIKGELKIPGYSSYLHPYDETHVIGIGYNVRTTASGGVTNETVKLSMFDVSDLSKPKEVFTKTLGHGYSYSDVMNRPKLLMYDKERNLMGFPISMKDESGKYINSIVLLEVDLNNNEFKLHSQYDFKDYNYYLKKVIYIEDTIYILCENEILSFDINSLDLKETLKLPDSRSNSTYYMTDDYIDVVKSEVNEEVSE